MPNDENISIDLHLSVLGLFCVYIQAFPCHGDFNLNFMQMKWMKNEHIGMKVELNSLQLCVETKMILILVLFHCYYWFS